MYSLQGTLQILSQIPTQPQRDGYSELYFSLRKLEAQLAYLTYPKLHSWLAAEPEFNPRHSLSPRTGLFLQVVFKRCVTMGLCSERSHMEDK